MNVNRSGRPPPGESVYSMDDCSLAVGEIEGSGLFHDAGVQDSQGWITAVKNVGEWHLGIDKWGGGRRGGIVTPRPRPIRPTPRARGFFIGSRNKKSRNDWYEDIRLTREILIACG